MNNLELRRRVMFNDGTEGTKNILEGLRIEWFNRFEKATDLEKKSIVDGIVSISIDLQSFIYEWNLKKELSEKDIKEEVEKNFAVLEDLGQKDSVQDVKNEVNKIKTSNQYKLAVATNKGELNNRLGNDAVFGLTDAVRRGTCLVTTNPVMVNQEVKANPEKWTIVRDDLKKEYPEASPELMVTLLTMEVIYESCLELLPIYLSTNGEYGYVSLQINPKNSNDSKKMIDEVEYIYDSMKKRLGSDAPNLVFKVPATEASLSTVEKMTKSGIGVNITGSCSIAQHLALAEVIEKGTTKASYLTMMSGRLDDKIADELREQGVQNADEISRMASEAIVRRSCQLLYDKYEYKKSALLIASLRGPWNVDAGISDKSMPVFVTCFPDKANEYDEVARDLNVTIDDPISEETLEVLNKSEIFRQGYEIDGLKKSEFASFFPVKITLEGFSKQYDETLSFVTK